MLPEKPTLDELEHFGVKGMHWGVRHKPQGGSLKPGRATGEIRTARRNVRQAKKASIKEKAKFVVGKSSMEKVHEKKLDFLMHPDRPTASRLTRGESVVVGLLGSPTALAANQFNSRLIESRQKEGYKKEGTNRARVRVIGR